MLISSYLRVNVLGVRSDTIDVPSGVPQGGNFFPCIWHYLLMILKDLFYLDLSI